MSLKTLAGLSGVSVGWLSEVENGKRTVDRRSHFLALAAALRVAVTDLTGQPVPPVNPEHSRAHAAIPAIRLALMRTSLDAPADVEPRPVEQAASDVARAELLAQACSYSTLGELLPGLLTDLHVHASSGDEAHRSRGLRLLAGACHAAYMQLKALGFLELAWMAAERHHTATARLGDPVWSAMSDFLRAHMLLPSGAADAAGDLADKATARLEGRTSDRVTAQLYGMLHLTSAFAATVAGKPGAQEHLAEAASLAEHLGEGDAFHLYFGPANVAAWRVAIGVESGDGPKVVEHVMGINMEAITSAKRRAYLCADLGRGLAEGRRREHEAIAMLCQAERLAPQWVPSDPLLRQTVTNLLARRRLASSNRDLRGLAYRMGIA
jgi:transcriptional regulator with XRE-family HTH domain